MPLLMKGNKRGRKRHSFQKKALEQEIQRKIYCQFIGTYSEGVLTHGDDADFVDLFYAVHSIFLSVFR